jgi:uncharacterized protein (DUF433 family)
LTGHVAHPIRSIRSRLRRGMRVTSSPERGSTIAEIDAAPVKALFENLESGATVDQFLEWFPGVTREDALAVLEFAEKSLATA